MPAFDWIDRIRTHGEYPRTQTLGALIKTQAGQTPDRPAVVMGAGSPAEYRLAVHRSNPITIRRLIDRASTWKARILRFSPTNRTSPRW